ncbi:MAG TPA: translation elongation factor Ts [Candidatus Omnitrophota bacterium]|nr:translation elongation factor Ts [Candidatus Omnitrophota bacterium]
MGTSVDAIKELREMTSCGVIECKKALEEAKGDFDKAKKILQQRGLEVAAKKSGRAAKEGRVEIYVHPGNKMAVMVEVNCETDFVARNTDFMRFAKDVAMHIAAMNPKYIKEEDVPAGVLEGVEDKKTFIKEQCLMSQAFVKDTSKTVQDYLNEIVAKIGENMFVGRFARYKVGQSE